METDKTYLKEQLREARRYLDSERERLQEQIDTHNSYLKFLEHYEEMLEENEQLKSDLEEQQAENDRLHQLLDEKDKRQKETEALLKEKETQLNELGKFSVNVAKKSPQEGLEKAFRIYINTSKRKTQAKREVARAQLLDFIATAKLEMPDDIMEALNQLDDEVVAEPAQISTMVNVQAGGINVQQANTVAK
jgi:septal ring factor EnvC (AmiA/AmiB activator)